MRRTLLLLALLALPASARPPHPPYKGVQGTGAGSGGGGGGGNPPVWMNSGDALGKDIKTGGTTFVVSGLTTSAGKIYVGWGTGDANLWAHTSCTCSAGTCGGLGSLTKEIDVTVAGGIRVSIWSGGTTGLSGATITCTPQNSVDGGIIVVGVTGAASYTGTEAHGDSTDTTSPFDVGITIGSRANNSLIFSVGCAYTGQTMSAGTGTSLMGANGQGLDGGGDGVWVSRYSTDVNAGTYTVSVTAASGFTNERTAAVEIVAQ